MYVHPSGERQSDPDNPPPAVNRVSHLQGRQTSRRATPTSYTFLLLTPSVHHWDAIRSVWRKIIEEAVYTCTCINSSVAHQTTTHSHRAEWKNAEKLLRSPLRRVWIRAAQRRSKVKKISDLETTAYLLRSYLRKQKEKELSADLLQITQIITR